MSRTHKVLQVLQLYDERHPVLRVAEIAGRLGVSPATAYRCVDDLERAGLLECIGAGLYVLGPAIVELDRQVRIADPLIAAAGDISRGLAERTRGNVLLCRLHGLKVLCVHHVAGSAAPRVNDYERGLAMSLYRGATSRAILAHLPAATLQRLLDEDAAGLRRAGWPTELEALQRRLAAQRDEGVQYSAGELNPQARAWAVPLFVGAQLVGSLSVVRDKASVAAGDGPRIADALRRAALRIQARLEDVAAATRTGP